MKKLNYIELVNKFWELDNEHPFNSSDTRLYFFLLHTCNQLGWKIPFGQSDRFLSNRMGVSINTIRDAKIRLQQRGLITFSVPEIASKGIAGQTKYLFGTVSKIDTVIDTVQKLTVSEIDTVELPTISGTVLEIDTVPDTNIKLNKTITDKEVSDAIASHPKKAKKKKKEGATEDETPKSKIYVECIKIYDSWFKLNNQGEIPKLDGTQGKAMNHIITHLKAQVTAKAKLNGKELTPEELEPKIIEAWQFIFNNWQYVSDYQKKNTRLSDINNQLQNTLKNIRDGISTPRQGNGTITANNHSGKGGNKGATVDELQSLKRSRSTDSEERTEQSDAYVVGS